MIVKESIKNILKPKSEEEIKTNLENLSDEEMVDFVMSKGVQVIEFALQRRLNQELNGKLLKYVVGLKNIPLILQILKRNLSSKGISEALSKIRWTSKPTNEQLEIFDLLMSDKRMDPSEEHNILIRWASGYGLTDLVKFLLQDPRVDPSDYNNAALKGAEMYEHRDIVNLLMNDKRVIDKMKRHE